MKPEALFAGAAAICRSSERSLRCPSATLKPACLPACLEDPDPLFGVFSSSAERRSRLPCESLPDGPFPLPLTA